ncbi:MAG: ATP-binding cassette domain-containing protein [Chloroflexi bacterium]|nr:ATP-binding cassette domain-containing protein [Chloroflexota bacterium]
MTSRLVFIGLGLLLLAYLVAPVAFLLPSLLGGDLAASAELLPAALGVSLVTSTVATAAATLLGVPLAYWLARTAFPGRRLALALVFLPMVLPPITGGILLLQLFGPYGPFGMLLQRVGVVVVQSELGIVLAQLFVVAPFVVVAAQAAFLGLDPELELAAATLGRSPFQVFWRVALPLALPGILAGVLLAWLRALGEFGATLVLSFHPYTLPVLMWVQLTGTGLAAALPLAGIAVALALLLMAPTIGLAAEPLTRRRAEQEPRPEPDVLRGPARLDPEALPLTDAGPPAVGATHPSPLRPEGPQGTGPAHLRVRLVKRLGTFRLDVTLEVGPEILVLFGPSGSGKTTLLRAIAGLVTPEEGEIRVNGATLFAAGGINLPVHERRIGYLFQHYALFPHLSVRQNILFGADRHDGGTEERLARLLHMTRLAGLEGRYPRQLSGGQQQRAALARALMPRPRLLLLDEPFSALDSNVRESLQQDLLRLQSRLGLTVLYVTHDLRDAISLGDRIAVLNEGRIEQMGPKLDVFRRPRTEAVARFVGTRNLFHGRVREATHAGLLIEANGTTIQGAAAALQSGDPVVVCIRPEQVRLVRAEAVDLASDGAGPNRWPGRVVHTVALGASYRVWFRRDPPEAGSTSRPREREYDLVVEVAARTYETLGLARDPRCVAHLPPAGLHLIPL